MPPKISSTGTPRTRAPVTAAERTILTDLVKTIEEMESHFCCGGVIPLSPERNLSLFYKVGEEDSAGSLDLPPTKDTDVDKLLDACVPSRHGRGNETVYDESYRLARELHQGNFTLTVDILNESGVLDTIAALTSSRGPTGGLVARLYKLNIYGVGGFFKAHRDTPKSDRHIGTLVVALPVSFKGGALRVKHEDKEVLFDWSEEFSASSETPGLPWAFLFSDVEHEVLPVTSGTRITLAYDIFTSAKAPLHESLAIDVPNLPFYSELKAALKNPKFMSNGGKLGVALSHSYPVDSNSTSEYFATHLKGGDAVLFRAICELGITPKLRAVYASGYTGPDSDVDSDSDSEHEKPCEVIPDDEFGPVDPYTARLLLTSTEYTFLDLEDVTLGWFRREKQELLKKHTRAQIELDIAWVRKPSPDVYTRGGNFVTYGNEACVDSVYVAAALVLDIPAMQEGIRIAT